MATVDVSGSFPVVVPVVEPGSVPIVTAAARRAASKTRKRRDDRWVGFSALAAAMCALPLSTSSWHGPEVSAVLAVSATILLAGQRWAVALVAMAELLLLPTVLPRAFLAGDALSDRIAPFLALVAIVPGLLALRRAAAALVLLTGRARTQRMCRRFHTALMVAGVALVIAGCL